MIQEGTGKRSL